MNDDESDSVVDDEDVSAARKLVGKLRWITLGYHYDWTAKVYYPDRYTEFPRDLANLISHVCICMYALYFDLYMQLCLSACMFACLHTFMRSCTWYI